MRSEWMLLGVLILSATGCENAAEQEQVRVLSARRAAGNVTYSCSQKMEQSAEYQALKGKLPPLDGSPPPMSLQLNTAKPTADEAKTVLSFYEGQVVPCRGTVRDAYRNVTPAMVAIMDRGDADSDMAYARLIKREVSWGDYAQADYQRNIKTRDQLQQAQNQLNQDLGNAVGK